MSQIYIWFITFFYFYSKIESEMNNKGITFYLNILAASLGLSIFFNSAWCLIRSLINTGNPLSSSFWDYFFSNFQIATVSFAFLWAFVYIVTLFILKSIGSSKKSA